MKKAEILEQLRESLRELKEVKSGAKKAVDARRAIAKVEKDLKEERSRD